MNWVLLIAALLIVWRLVDGYRNGFMEELSRTLTLFVILAIIGLVIVGVGGYMNQTIWVVVAAIVLIIVVCAIHKLLSIPIESFQKATKISGIKWVDKTLGVAMGLAEGFVLLWFLFALISCIDVLGVPVLPEWVNGQVDQSFLLTQFNKWNFMEEGLLKILQYR